MASKDEDNIDESSTMRQHSIKLAFMEEARLPENANYDRISATPKMGVFMQIARNSKDYHTKPKESRRRSCGMALEDEISPSKKATKQYFNTSISSHENLNQSVSKPKEKKVLVFEKQYQYFKVKNEDREESIKRAHKNELEQCTFSPAISNSRKTRHFKDFLKEQQEHSLKKIERLSELTRINEKAEKDQLKEAPTISENSHTLCVKTKDCIRTKAHVRLYRNIEKNIKCKPDEQSSQYSFRPEVSENSKKILNDSNSAKKFKSPRLKTDSTTICDFTIQDRPSINPESQRVHDAKIDKVINENLKNYNELIEFKYFMEILKKLCFVKSNAGKDEAKDEALMQEMWSILAKGKEQVKKQDLVNLLRIIMGYTISTTEIGAVNLQQKFALFKRNRFSALKIVDISRCENSEEKKKFTFSPKISTVSSNIVNSARRKTNEPRIRYSSPTENSMLSKSGSFRESFFNTNRSSHKDCGFNLKEEKKDMECTFTPKIHRVPSNKKETKVLSINAIREKLSPKKQHNDANGLFDLSPEVKKATTTKKSDSSNIRNNSSTSNRRQTSATKKPKEQKKESPARKSKAVQSVIKQRDVQTKKVESRRTSQERVDLYQKRLSLKKCHETALNTMKLNTVPRVQDAARRKIDSILADPKEESKSTIDSSKPLAHIQISLGSGREENIILKESDTADKVAESICRKYGFDVEIKKVISSSIQNKINILTRERNNI